jgi:hypothetical protein
MTFFLYTILFITITVPVAIVIFDFFDIKFEFYGNYLLWFIALAIFNSILPYKQTSIFDDDIVSRVKKNISNIITPAQPSSTTSSLQLPRTNIPYAVPGIGPSPASLFKKNINDKPNPDSKTKKTSDNRNKLKYVPFSERSNSDKAIGSANMVWRVLTGNKLWY